MPKSEALKHSRYLSQVGDINTVHIVHIKYCKAMQTAAAHHFLFQSPSASYCVSAQMEPTETKLMTWSGMLDQNLTASLLFRLLTVAMFQKDIDNITSIILQKNVYIKT